MDGRIPRSERERELTKGTVFLSEEKKWTWSEGLRKGKRQKKEHYKRPTECQFWLRHITRATTFDFHGIT